VLQFKIRPQSVAWNYRLCFRAGDGSLSKPRHPNMCARAQGMAQEYSAGLAYVRPCL
jgi:hypothetical protein